CFALSLASYIAASSEMYTLSLHDALPISFASRSSQSVRVTAVRETAEFAEVAVEFAEVAVRSEVVIVAFHVVREPVGSSASQATVRRLMTIYDQLMTPADGNRRWEGGSEAAASSLRPAPIRTNSTNRFTIRSGDHTHDCSHHRLRHDHRHQ